MFDFSMLSSGEYAALASLLLGMLVGKAIGAETRILTGMVIVGVVAPDLFVAMALSVILLAVLAKGLSQWVSWL